MCRFNNFYLIVAETADFKPDEVVFAIEVPSIITSSSSSSMTVVEFPTAAADTEDDEFIGVVVVVAVIVIWEEGGVNRLFSVMVIAESLTLNFFAAELPSPEVAFVIVISFVSNCNLKYNL